MKRTLIQFATAAVLLTGATVTRSQITNPDTLVGKPPRNPAQRGPAKPVYNLQWLWQYTNNKPALVADRRYANLLDDNLRAPQAFWSVPGSPLADAARAFLAGPGSVTASDNRYLTVTGCVVDPAPDADTKPCSQRGLLWLDLGRSAPDQAPLLIFAALRWNEESRSPGQAAAPYTLWLFPNRSLDAQQLPSDLKRALGALTVSCPTFNVTSVVVVDPSGTPHLVSALGAGVTPSICNAISHSKELP